jgi:hypothetical protein
MARNQKLTPILAGRTVEQVRQSDNTISVRFTDDSIMSIKTAAPATIQPFNHRTVKAIRQQDNVMHLDFADDSTVAIELAGPTASVMVRDHDNKLEYAD